MSKITLADVTSLENQTSAETVINNNSAAIEAAFDNTLSRDGSIPNQMAADIDMNGNDLLNVGTLDANDLIVDGTSIVSEVTAAAASAASAAAHDASAGTHDTNAAASATAAAASAASIGFTIDIDSTLAANSDTRVPSQKAVKSALTSSTTFTQTGTGAVPVTAFSGRQGRVFTPEQFGAKGDTRIVSDSVTASGTTVSTVNANFTAADVGKKVSIGGCGYQVVEDVTVASGGTGYSDFDQLLVAGGTQIEQTKIVVNQTAGVASVNQLYVLGKYASLPSNPVSVTGGTGTGATFNLTWRSLAHTSTITAVSADGKTLTLSVGVIFAIASQAQKIYVGTDDTTAIAEVLAAAVAQTQTSPASIHFSGVYTSIDTQHSTSLASSKFPLSMVGTVPGATIHIAQLTGNKWGFDIEGASPFVVGSGGIAADATEGDRTLTFSSAAVSQSGLLPGDYVYVNAQNGAGYAQGFVTQVRKLSSGSTYIVSDPVPIDIDHNQPISLTFFRPVTNCTVSDLTIDGFGTISNLSIAMAFFYHAGLTVRNLQVKNFWSDNSSSFGTYCLYGAEIDIRSDFCGGGTGADAITIGAISHSDLRAHQKNSYGFGIGLNYASDNKVNFQSGISKGRSVKLAGSCGNYGYIEAGNAQQGFIGVGYTSRSSRNSFELLVRNCWQGIWSDGTGNIKNIVTSYRYAGNVNQDIAIASGDSYFDIYCAPGPAPVIVDGTTGSVIRQMGKVISPVGYISSSVLIASSVPMTTSTTTNIASITLPAGDWDVRGSFATNAVGGPTMTTVSLSVSAVSATFPVFGTEGANNFWRGSTAINMVLPTGTARISLATTTTVYLVANVTFTGGTSLSGYGFIGAQRIY